MSGEAGEQKARTGKKRSPRHLDILDRRILRLVRDDARRPNAEIARVLGVSEPTIRKRLDRLRDSGVLRIIGFLDPVATGFPIDVFLAIKVRHGAARRLGEQLAALNATAFVGHTTGRFDMLVEAFFADTTSLLDFYRGPLGSDQGVISFDTYHILRVDKFNYMWDLPNGDDTEELSSAESLSGRSAAPAPNRPGSAVELDVLDRQILRLLREDGRRSNAEIARAMNSSEPTIRKRIERLHLTGVLRIIGLLDPAATGYPVYAMILIETEPDSVREVGARLAALDRVAYVSYISGRAQIWCEAMLPSNEALYSFLSTDLLEIPGIVSTEAVQVLAVEKFNYMWELPEPETP